MNFYIEMFKNYVNFKGRTAKKPFWMAILFNVIAAVVLYILAMIVKPLSILYSLYCLAVILPCLGMEIRRLHDIGKSGWWILLGCIPLVGTIILIVFFVKDSVPEENAWGRVPGAEEMINA